MSKLHKKMVALGNLSEHSYDSIVAACGEPKEKKPCTFSDIGEGFRATWSEGVFVLALNFDKEGAYCGIYHHRNWEPYIVTAIVSVVIIAGALVVTVVTGGDYAAQAWRIARRTADGAGR